MLQTAMPALGSQLKMNLSCTCAPDCDQRARFVAQRGLRRWSLACFTDQCPYVNCVWLVDLTFDWFVLVNSCIWLIFFCDVHKCHISTTHPDSSSLTTSVMYIDDDAAFGESASSSSSEMEMERVDSSERPAAVWCEFLGRYGITTKPKRCFSAMTT